MKPSYFHITDTKNLYFFLEFGGMGGLFGNIEVSVERRRFLHQGRDFQEAFCELHLEKTRG